MKKDYDSPILIEETVEVEDVIAASGGNIEFPWV